jgi:hypothetical protein
VKTLDQTVNVKISRTLELNLRHRLTPHKLIIQKREPRMKALFFPGSCAHTISFTPCSKPHLDSCLACPYSHNPSPKILILDSDFATSSLRLSNSKKKEMTMEIHENHLLFCHTESQIITHKI